MNYDVVETVPTPSMRTLQVDEKLSRRFSWGTREMLLLWKYLHLGPDECLWVNSTHTVLVFTVKEEGYQFYYIDWE